MRPMWAGFPVGVNARAEGLMRCIMKAMMMIVFVLVLVLHGRTAVLADGLCLDNNGERTVKAGTTYRDTQGTWLCAPGSPGSTDGGWLLIAATPAPTATTMPTSTPPVAATPPSAPLDEPATPPDHTGGPLIPLFAVPLVVAFGATTSMYLLARRRGRRLTGCIIVEKECADERS